MNHRTHWARLLALITGASLAGWSAAEPPASPAKPGATQPSASQPPASQPAAPKPAAPKEGADKPRVFTPEPKTDKGWVERNERFNARAREGAEKGDIGVIFLGDSITQGWEGAGRAVWEKRYAPRHAVNFGIGGDRTEHVVWRVEHGNMDGLATPKAGAAPKLVVVMIGTNNSGINTAEQIAEGVTKVVGAVRAKLPTTKVLLLGIFPRSEKPDATRAKVARATELAKGAADGTMVEFLDIGGTFVGKDGTIDKAIMPDFLHLSERGYEMWADAIEPAVKRMLGE